MKTDDISRRQYWFPCEVRSQKTVCQARFTRDRTGIVPNRTGPDRASVYTFWNRSGTDPSGSKIGPIQKQVQFWIRLKPFRTGSRTVPCRQKAYPIRFSDRIHLDPFGSGPRVNIASSQLN